ncbi:helix-turn-helix transcriptional regulator [Massilia rhizosphaerae]|uniref:helix-turn-helix transcriptional regulator n=1 Tax=Massilia rhizosphaerae TaxID=2784389 RepID=UPI0018DD5066|nr:AlpA family phage regulatory protein [Massilia rhizosphaerae]
MSASASQLKKVLRVKHMKEKLAMSVASLYNKMNPRSKYYDASFPRPIRLSASPGPGGAIGWLESDVDAWLESRQHTATKLPSGM